MSAALEQIHGVQLPGLSPVVASLERVNKNYGAVRALNGVDFRVRAGEVVALLGPNGAGKTTAVKLLLGLLQPNAGKVRVFRGDPTNPENRMRTGAMLQVGRVPETLRVREHIDLFSTYYEKPMGLAEVLSVAGLENLKNRKFGDLSGGQKQRVLFALAICGDPDLLFLDEPTVGLDVEARRMLWDQIRQLVRRGKTVLLTTHYLQEADALADRVAVINKGEIIAEGTPGEIKAQTAGKKIRCITSVSLGELRRIAGVTEVREDREAVEIHTAEAEPVLRELFARDASVSGLEVTSAGLEEAFLALTQEASKNGNSH
ncbi:MAG TPA: ABC transporter ATP-binding protein [Candidatus Sulfotelmatobacter sp.]|nr:ABC transporter ATP-binding protein [Candidatus Sulfotelmatobacter sp.]